MVSELESGLKGPDSGPGWVFCVVFLVKTLKSQECPWDYTVQSSNC